MRRPRLARGKICGGNGNSKISPAYSWNIPQAPVYEENPSICDIFVLWGYLGYVPGICWILLKDTEFDSVNQSSSRVWEVDLFHDSSSHTLLGPSFQDDRKW